MVAHAASVAEESMARTDGIRETVTQWSLLMHHAFENPPLKVFCINYMMLQNQCCIAGHPAKKKQQISTI